MMRNKFVLLLCFLGCLAFGGCSYGSKEGVQPIVEESVTDEGSHVINEQYYSEKVVKLIKKYPELNTKEVAFVGHSYGYIVVSPYADTDVVKAVTHLIQDEGYPAYCYHDYLYDEYSDNFKRFNFDALYEIIQGRVDQAREKAEKFDEKFQAELEKDSELHISPEGEYYYLLDMDNFEASADIISSSVKRHEDAFDDYEMQFQSEYYFINEKREFIGGYRGVTYSIYLDSYAEENKVYQYYFWKSKNQWIDIYSDLYQLLIYDPKTIEDQVNPKQNNLKPLSCCITNRGNTEGGKRSVDYFYQLFEEEFKPEEAIATAYKVYKEVIEANDKFNTHKVDSMDIAISNFLSYGKEYKKIELLVSLEKNYSEEEFKQLLLAAVRTEIESEPE